MKPRLIFILLMIVTLAACGIGVEASQMPAMPTGFETIHLGMSVVDLRAARPQIRRDDWPYSPMYFEQLPVGDPSQFSFVKYTFDKKTNRLVEISFSWSGPLPEVERRCGALVDFVTVRLGAADARRIGIVERHYVTGARHEYPMLEWKRDGAAVAATCSLFPGSPRFKSFYDLMISTPEVAKSQTAAVKWRPADDAEFKRLFGRLLERRADAPEFR